MVLRARVGLIINSDLKAASALVFNVHFAYICNRNIVLNVKIFEQVHIGT